MRPRTGRQSQETDSSLAGSYLHAGNHYKDNAVHYHEEGQRSTELESQLCHFSETLELFVVSGRPPKLKQDATQSYARDVDFPEYFADRHGNT
jgi:hypothetical protein